MSVSRSPGARELGAEIQRLRKQAGLTLRAFALVLGCSDTKISLWETGQRLASAEDLAEALDALKVPSAEKEKLLGVRREVEGAGELAVAGETTTAQLAHLIEQQQHAKRIVDVAPLLIPGLLQIDGYARAILGGFPDADMRIAVRMGRRDIVTRARNPVELHAIIDLEVITRAIAPAAVMADQLRHLLEMAERPNVAIQLVSSNGVEYTPMLAGPFVFMEFPSASPIVHVEHYRASVTVWKPDVVTQFGEAVDKIIKMAMTPERTSEVIAEIVHGMETT